MNIFRALLAIQCIYTLLTALWPLADIESFMAVTGYKIDVWLVKTVGALLVSIALCMGTHLFIHTDHRPVVVLCITSAIGFICIDFYYALNDVIRDIYMVDGCFQIVLLLAWCYIVAFRYKLIKAAGVTDVIVK
ncbi:MAG TPA: hypothetical protein VIM75_02780 [Ohtaekwangia sp.]|uniref:hypothetical protein n=1 Tax=Ohtaekwangia sp. TaxID=2066019 RepID=UPI002F92AB8E